MRIVFILYRPAVPGNVGAAARAMKTMGFSELRLIESCDHLADEALMMAHGSREILENASVFSDFEKATADLDLVACTTAKGRTAKHEYHSSRGLRNILEQKGKFINSAGILFGTEESGLPNELVLKSDLATSIPMFAGYPSLNLSQAVMVMAYELSPLNELQKPGRVLDKSGEGFGELKKQSISLLKDAGIQEGTPLHHRIMERMALMGSNDIPLLLSVIKRLKS